MTNSDPDKVDFLAFSKAEFSISSTISSPNFYIAFLLSFGVFALIALSVIYKNQRYKKQGFLATEKSELKIMLEDIRSSVVVSSKNKVLDNKNLFQLFTESDSIDALKHPEGSSSNNSVFKKQTIQKNNNHSSSKDSTSKSTEQTHSNKKPMRKQNAKQQKKKTQAQDNSIHIHKGQISFSQSLSERFPKVQQSKQNPVILSDKKNNFTSSVKDCRNVSGITEDQEFYVKENQSDLTQNEEQDSHKTSAICSFASLSRPNNLLPAMDSSQLVNVSANYSTIITPGHTQKLMESSPQNSVIIVLADEKNVFQNDNQDNYGEEKKQEQSTSQQLQQEYLPTQMLCVTANNINNENQLTQIAPLNCSQNQNNCDDAHVIQLDDVNQITRIQEKEKNNNNNRQVIQLSTSTLSRKNTDLSVSKVNSLTSNIKPTSFFKEISRLCFRHNMFVNTLKEDSVLFPRVLKCVIIHCNICLLLLAGSFVQIYYYNSELSHLKDKSTEFVSFSTVKPSSSAESFLREFSLSFEVALFLIAGSMGLTVFSKSDPQIIFINNNNQQLQRNLLEVRSNQSYKIFFSCFFAFVLSAFCFVQFFAFFQVLPSEFILRWALIGFIVFLLIFMIFDIFYFSFLIILRFRSSFSPRCLHLYSMLLSKAAWWAL